MSSSKCSLFTYAGGKEYGWRENYFYFLHTYECKVIFQKSWYCPIFSCFQSHDYLQVWVNTAVFHYRRGTAVFTPPPSALWMLRVCFWFKGSICLAYHLLPHPHTPLLKSSIHIIGKCHKIKMRGCFQHGDRRIMPVCLNYFFLFWNRPWLLTVSIIITFNYSIKLSTTYITEVFHFCSVVIIEDECILAAFETKQGPIKEISQNSSGKVCLIGLYRTWYSRQGAGWP